MHIASLLSPLRCSLVSKSEGFATILRFLSISSTARNSNVEQGWKKYMEDLDPIQAKFYHEEQLIRVDKNDQVIGPLSKGESHAMETIRNDIFHRALSLFVFNGSGQFLLTQRSSSKITFPDCFTNACCSHPLFNNQELQDSGDAIGVKRATIRRASFELGISESEILPTDLKLVNRFLYQAESEGAIWGESEIDYVFILKKDLKLRPNPDEIRSTRYVDRDEMRSLVENHTNLGIKLTPWIKLIAADYLFRYWDNLDRLDIIADPKTIVRFEGIMPASFIA